MGCNCKRKIDLEKKFGVKQEENFLVKTTRYVFKILFFVIGLILAIIAIPYLIISSVFSIFFGKNRIALPKFLRKYFD